MKPAAIPGRHHVLRYCRPKQVVDGTVTMSAFLLRPGEEFLSVNWLEFFGDIAAEAQVEKVRVDMRKSLTLSAGGRFARVNVGEVTKRIEKAEVRHLPSPRNPSHAGIYAHGENRLTAILALAHLLTPGDIFPGKA